MNPGGFGGREAGLQRSRIRRALEQMGVSEGSRGACLKGAEAGPNSKRRQAVTQEL